MLTKEKETSYLDKGFVHSLNVFFLFVSLSLTHTSVILLSFVLQRKGRVRLCWVLQSSQDKSSASTDKKTRQFSLKTGILHWRKKKKVAQNLLTLSSFFIFFLRSVVLGQTLVWLSRASESLFHRHQKALFTAVIVPARNDAAALNLRLI